MPVLRKTYTFSTTHKVYFIFFNITNKSIFVYLKVVSLLSKNTNNPPLVYIKLNVNKKCVIVLLLFSHFYIFLEFREIFSQPLFLDVFKYFQLKLLNYLILYYSRSEKIKISDKKSFERKPLTHPCLMNDSILGPITHFLNTTSG